MRVTIFLLLVSILQTFANDAYSQKTKLSFDFSNKKLVDALSEIEEHTEFYFLYNDNLVDTDQRINLTVAGQTIDKVLDGLFSGTNIKYTITDRKIILTPDHITASLQQQNSVSGKVTDSSGSPLPGVTVVVKGTTQGIITDVDGNFTIQCSSNAILVFSFVGMKTQEILVAGHGQINVVMEEETVAIEEVVAIGYGVQKKVNLTGAVAAVKVDETLTSRSLQNVSSGLQGLLPGLAVIQNSGMAGKNDVSLTIRGLGTVNNANPLIVVDGMPDVDINRININDIESVSVLKDAAASAVYGSRAANGVILITTKSGKGSKTNVSFSGSYGISNPTKKYEFMADYPRALTVHQRAALTNTLLQNQVYRNGTIDQWMALGMIDPLRYPNTDWWDVILRQGVVKNYNLSASGSSEKSSFFTSIGMMDEKGLQINNDYSRYNARFNYEYNVFENMNIGTRFNGNWSKYTYTYDNGYTNNADQYGTDILWTAIAGITPYDPVTGYYGATMAYGESSTAYNPYANYMNILNRQNRQEANIAMYWNWSPVKGLMGSIDYALNYYNQFSYNANMPQQAYNFQTEQFTGRWFVNQNAAIGNSTNTGYKTQLTGRLNYQFTIADHHNISALLVYNEEYWYSRNQYSSRNDRIHPSLHEINAALTTTQGTGGSSETEGLRSYIGRFNYSAFDKYLLEFNFRVDGSSRFYEGSQYGFFPSAALGWRFTEEDFMKQTGRWLSSGKLRASYGSLGNNSGVGRFEQKETLTTNNYAAGGIDPIKGFVNSKMINQDLSWETTTVMNIGLDLGFLKSRLIAELDYYDRLTTDMNRPSDLSLLLSGAYSPAPRRNIGNLRNRGVEGNITWKDQKGEFSYLINLNASYNTTRLEKWNEYLGRGYVFIDMPYHFVYAFEAIGIAQTWQDVYDATPQNARPGDILRKDKNGDGRIDDNDKVAYSNLQRDRPTTNYALNLHAEWKGIDLSVMFQGAAGRKNFWINQYNATSLNGTQRYASSWNHWNNTWSYDNRDADWPRLNSGGPGAGNNSESTFWLDSMDYLRLKNIQLGYSLPKKWLTKIHLSNARIYGSGENIFTITKFRGLDPEKAGSANDAYPLLRSFSIGMNIGI
ncbi:MAG: TonB-dependent receptor [Mangrovibacterium sp.]